MKLRYTWEEVERWRDRVHRRLPRLAVKSRSEALSFIQAVGYCFAFKADHSELPCLWHAVCGMRDPVLPRHTHHDPTISFVWEMKDRLPADRKIYYGKLLRHRPTMVSLEYLPFFYALSGRMGGKDEYVTEHRHGRISATARAIMEALEDSSPQVTKGLKLATGKHLSEHRTTFDKAIAELQTKMFIVKVDEEDDPFTFVWAPFTGRFPTQVRKARRVTAEDARYAIGKKYFENQLIGSATTVQRLFRWGKREIFRTIARLLDEGIVTPDVRVEGTHATHYCLIERA
jgi:hypothetical protein